MRTVDDAKAVINALLEISSLVTRGRDLGHLYEEVHRIIADVILVENIAIFLYDEQTQTIKFEYFIDQNDDASLIGESMPLGSGVSSYVLRTNRPCLLSGEDIRDLEAQGQIANALGTDSHSWMGVPISSGDDLFGIIIIQSYREDVTYSTADLNILEFVAAQLAVVIENKMHAATEFAAKELIQANLDVIQRQNAELEEAISTLQRTRDELVQKEKMASLGGLVAGIAHEVNTPIGVCLTATSNLKEEVKFFVKRCEAGAADDQDLQALLECIDESCDILLSNTNKAAALVSSFKKVAVDQSSDQVRDIDLPEYVQEVITSLRPVLKRTAHKIRVNGPEQLIIRSNAGAIAQILTNLITNSLTHGFENRDDGNITIDLSLDRDVTLRYEDDGAGMTQEALERLFEPFYTTRRGTGGSGLGAHLIFNLVSAALGGSIEARSEPGKGLCYTITFPSNIDQAPG